MPETQSKLEACASLIAEHRQMEKLLETMQQRVQALPEAQNLTKPQWANVDAIMADISREMDIHFACEEESLFPTVEPYHPMVLMEVEHEELMALRNGLLQRLGQDCLDAEEIAELKELANRLAEEMFDHIGREDAGIFPACERALSDDEKQQVIDGMERIREKARAGSIPRFSRPERTFSMMQADLDTPLARAISTTTLGERAASQVKQLNIKAGESLASHWSPRLLTIVCLSGEGVFVSGEERIPIQPGSVVQLDPQLRHAIEATTDCRFLMLMQAV